MFENGQNISRSGQFVFIHNHLQDILEPWNHICLWSKLPTLKLIYWHMDKKPLWASMTVICLNLKGNTLHTKLHHHWLTDHLQIHHHKFPRLEQSDMESSRQDFLVHADSTSRRTRALSPFQVGFPWIHCLSQLSGVSYAACFKTRRVACSLESPLPTTTFPPPNESSHHHPWSN